MNAPVQRMPASASRLQIHEGQSSPHGACRNEGCRAAGWVVRSPILHHPAALLLLVNVQPLATIASVNVPIKVADTVLTTTEAAKRMGLSEHTVRIYIGRGLLRAKKLGPIRVLTAAECDRYTREKRPRGRPYPKKTS
jgi:excisionase family DNA binding protein